MIRFAVYAMVYLGAALMVFNIYGFVRFAWFMRQQQAFRNRRAVLYVPVILLVLFLIGYVLIGLVGSPDLIIGGVLFGGSIFVYIMYRLFGIVTRRLLENEALQTELVAAEKANAAKTSFLSSVSHEMRTPLNVIMGLDRIAMKDETLREETRQMLDKIRLSAEHLLGLINNILDMNRIETGSLTPLQKEFSLEVPLRQVSAIAQTLCEEKGLAYSCTVQDGAPGRYLGDATELGKILLSILENAVKYTDAGSVHMQVDFEEEAEREESADEKDRASADGAGTADRTAGRERVLRFTVTDTGIGIAPEFLPKLFEAFTQEDASSTSRYGGSGLSLSLARRLAGMMGGTVTAESEKNTGSAFTVTVKLPYLGGPEPDTDALPEKAAAEQVRGTVPPEATAEGSPSGAEASATGDGLSLEGRRVLIVEDIPENAEIVQDLLELEGVVTEHVENGLLAVQRFEETPPGFFDAILMDLRMPVMDGLEASRRIRASGHADAKRIPIIALTANAFESDVRQTAEAGMNAHLAKPTDVDLLYSTLRELILRELATERKNET